MNEDGRQMEVPTEVLVEVFCKALVSEMDQVIGGSIGPLDTFHKDVDSGRNAFDRLPKMVIGIG